MPSDLALMGTTGRNVWRRRPWHGGWRRSRPRTSYGSPGQRIRRARLRYWCTGSFGSCLISSWLLPGPLSLPIRVQISLSLEIQLVGISIWIWRWIRISHILLLGRSRVVRQCLFRSPTFRPLGRPVQAISAESNRPFERGSSAVAAGAAGFSPVTIPTEDQHSR